MSGVQHDQDLGVAQLPPLVGGDEPFDDLAAVTQEAGCSGDLRRPQDGRHRGALSPGPAAQVGVAEIVAQVLREDVERCD
ncbi:hypothetical protein, partial [Streptomyces mirabilis]